jgi:hypothetical protein
MFDAVSGASSLIQAQAARVRAEFLEFYVYLAEYDVRLAEPPAIEQRSMQLTLRNEFAPPVQLRLVEPAATAEARR